MSSVTKNPRKKVSLNRHAPPSKEAKGFSKFDSRSMPKEGSSLPRIVRKSKKWSTSEVEDPVEVQDEVEAIDEDDIPLHTHAPRRGHVYR